MPDLNQLASSFEQAARESDAIIARRLGEFLQQTRNRASGIAHRVTGRLASGLYVDGPVRKAGGVEGVIRANVAYAEKEVARGGDHDYAGRTIAAIDQEFQQWADAIGVEIVKQIGGL